MAENNSTKREGSPAQTQQTPAPTYRIPPHTNDQKQYLSRIRTSEENPDLGIPLGGPRNTPAL